MEILEAFFGGVCELLGIFLTAFLTIAVLVGVVYIVIWGVIFHALGG